MKFGEGVRARLKRMLEFTAVRSGLAGLNARRMQQNRLILAYHNIVPSGERVWGERSLHLPAKRFREHLEVLSEFARIVPLSDILSSQEDLGEAGGGPRVAITFDDAYSGAVHAGVDELAHFAAPATFFALPGLVDQPGFWWDRLAEANVGVLPAKQRDRALNELRGRQEEVLGQLESEGVSVPEAPEYALPSSGEQLRALMSRPGIGLGCHTWSHPNLTRLSRREQATEFEKAINWLRELSGSASGILSYPYGMHDAQVLHTAREAGFRHAFRIDGGWFSLERDPVLAIPRLNVPAGLSPHGLRLRLSGLWRMT